MTKEEIALQLALKKLDCLAFTHIKSFSIKDDEAFNKDLGKQIASVYNAIYENLTCLDNDKTYNSFNEDSLDQDVI